MNIEKLIIRIIKKLKLFYKNDPRFSDCKWNNPSVDVLFKDNHLVLNSLSFYFDGGWSKLVVNSKGMSIITDYDKIVITKYEDFSFFDD